MGTVRECTGLLVRPGICCREAVRVEDSRIGI